MYRTIVYTSELGNRFDTPEGAVADDAGLPQIIAAYEKDLAKMESEGVFSGAIVATPQLIQVWRDVIADHKEKWERAQTDPSVVVVPLWKAVRILGGCQGLSTDDGRYVIEARHRKKNKDLGPWEFVAAFACRDECYNFFGRYHQYTCARVIPPKVERPATPSPCEADESDARKNLQTALADATELLDEIMRDEVNAQDEAEKWLRSYAPQYLRNDNNTRP